jgi:uncharacterized protein YndB with AHSA1/START domain
METANKTTITVATTVNAPVEKAWEFWNEPKHITQWCNASDDWHAPAAENDPVTNGKFKTTMAAKDGSMSFDFEGVYSNVDKHKALEYTIGDGRKVSVHFSPEGNETKIVERFEAENTHSIEMQQDGWQAILDNFKRYTEAN